MKFYLAKRRRKHNRRRFFAKIFDFTLENL